MDKARLQDTIIAVSTPPGSGGLGVVRLSGPDSLSIAGKLFVPRKRSAASFPPRTAVFGHVRDGENGRILDEAFLIFFPGPKSYTREDIVEISCHGSPAVLEEVVSLGVRAGAKPALPGEFTLRAYLRGRIDILQAEAVQSLIQSTSLEQARVSIAQVRGSLSQKIGVLRTKLIEIMAHIEARIEFSVEEPVEPGAALHELLIEAQALSGKLAASYETGRALAEGLRVVIAGRPNVGKSTLFNSLLGRERAIITPFPGTTRDYLSERLRLGGVNVVLTDMAGLGESEDPVEVEGMRLGRALADEADGVLLIIDASRETSEDDLRFVSGLLGKKLILLFNKMDLPEAMDREGILALHPDAAHLDISALRGTHIGELKELMPKVFAPAEKASDEVVLQLRQKLLLEEISRSLGLALARLEANFSEEFFAEDVRGALELIGLLTGEIASEEILDAVFGDFCVGK